MVQDLEVHGVPTELDPKLRPEKQHKMSKQGKLERPQIGQGRAGMRRRKPDHTNQPIIWPLDVTQGIPQGTKIETRKTNSAQGTNSMCDRSVNNNNDSFLPDVPIHQDQLLKPSTLLSTNKTKVSPNANLHFEENPPFQEGIISKTFQRLDKSFFQNPKELEDLIDKRNLIHTFLTKQTDIDRILEIIQRKVLKGTHLPVEVKEIQVGYLHSPYFKDLYQYLLQNKLPSSKSTIKKLQAISEMYVLSDSLLFRICPEKETAVLAIPETCVDKIITLYHKSLFAGHQGVIKTYLTISDKFFYTKLNALY